MDNDETNHNEDPGIEAWIDPAWEARIVALLQGEASEFEREDLERRMREHPELRVFHRRMLAMHGLLAEAFGTGTGTAGAAPLRLSPERRAAVLERIREHVATEAGAEAKGPKPMNLVEMERPKAAAVRRKKAWILAITSAAAVFVSMFVISRLFSVKSQVMYPPQEFVVAASAAREEDVHPSGAEVNDFAFREKGDRTYDAQGAKREPASAATVTGPEANRFSTLASGQNIPVTNATPSTGMPALLGEKFSEGFGRGGGELAGTSESHFGNEVARFAIPDAPSQEAKERLFAEMDGKAWGEGKSVAGPDAAQNPAPGDLPQAGRMFRRGGSAGRSDEVGQELATGTGVSDGRAADTVASIVTAQIRKATTQTEAGGAEEFTWASQPGAITTFRTREQFADYETAAFEKYKLYRSDRDQTASEESWVDLNAPASEESSSASTPQLHFPIVDPRVIEMDEAGFITATGEVREEAGKSPEGAMANGPETATRRARGASAPSDSVAARDEDASVLAAHQRALEGRFDESKQLLEEDVESSGESGHGNAERQLARSNDPEWDNRAVTPDDTATVQDADRLKDLGKDFYDLGDFDKAEMRYKEALRVDGTDAEARKGLEEVEQARVTYQRSSRDHTRAKPLREGVDQLWESEVPAPVVDNTVAGNAPEVDPLESAVAEVTSGKKVATDDFGLASLEKANLGAVAAGGAGQGGGRSGDVAIQDADTDGLLSLVDAAAVALPESGLEAEEAMKQQQAQGRDGEMTVDLSVIPETVEFEGFVNGGLTVAEGAEPRDSKDLFAGNLATEEELQRARFFLTHSSTSPQTTLKGTPRLSMWGHPEAPAEWDKADASGATGLLPAASGAGTKPADAGVVAGSLLTGGQGLATDLDRSERDESAPAKDAAHWAFKAPEVGGGELGGGTLAAQIQAQQVQVEASRLALLAEMEQNGIADVSGEMPASMGQNLESMPEDQAKTIETARSKGLSENLEEKRRSFGYLEAKNRYAEQAAILSTMTDALAKMQSGETIEEKAMEFNPPELPREFGSVSGGANLGFPVTPSNPTSIETVNEATAATNLARGFLEGEALGVPGEVNGRVSGEWDRSLAVLDTKLAEESKSDGDQPVDEVIVNLLADDPAKPAEPTAESAPEPTPPAEPAPPVEAQPEIETAVEPVSTFSLHVSDVSYKLAEAALLERGEWPEAGKVRIEEFVNAFDYGDPAPAPDEAVACRTEQAAHPFLPQRNLLRVAMRTGATGRASSQPLRLTVLLDKSGSMERADREASVLRAMDALASHLTPNDTVTLIGFARQPRLIADRLSGERANELAGLVERAPSEGGTNLEEALKLAGDKAREQFVEGGQNRIVLVTDGAANLGNARPESLGEMVVGLRQQGIAFDACGVGADGLNDAILEALTRQGDGRYYFLNRPSDADESFVRQLAGALRPAAKNVKVQVIFNPERVKSYRLLGFEKHLLKKEDFRDDAVDAAEMAAAEAGVGLYEMEVNPSGQGDVGEVFVRFLDMATGQMVERSWTIPYDAGAAPLDEATPSMQLAGTAAYLGMKLRGGPDAGMVRFDGFGKVTSGLRAHYAESPRVRRLLEMVEKVRGGE